MEQTRYTIYDIARRAGVSAKTVSRVLNGKSGVSEETRARIRRLIEDLGYHPQIGAQSLRGTHKGCIGVTLPAPWEEVPLTQEFFLWLFTELYRIFGSKGERVCFDLNPYNSTWTNDYGRSVWDKLFSACLIPGPLAVGDATILRIHGSGIPYVAFGRLDSLPECSSATVDYEEGAYLSTKFLLTRGHKRVAMLKAFTGYQPGVERLRGYRRALEEAGIAPEEKLVRSVNFGLSNIANQVHRLLVDETVTALVDASATEDGAGLRDGARRAGRVPGKDFEVVVWTYTDRAAVLREACGHVWLPTREAAAEGMELLAAWFYGEREGPVRVLYRPVLYEDLAEAEITTPKPLFDTFA
jgi:LacI family transcriptional regulator